MSTILITGAAGFLGSSLTEALGRRGDSVIALDLHMNQKLKRLSQTFPTITLAPGDLTQWPSMADIFQTYRPDSVIHCAAIVGVIASVGTPLGTMRVNIEGSINLLECMRLFDTRKMLQISSEEVYGNFSSRRIDEDHPRNPIQAYGISKAACEQLAKSYADLYGKECINLRTSWVYGAELPRNRVPKNLLTAAVDKTPLHLSSGADALIDHTYIDDFVTGVLGALDHHHHRFDTYHIASGKAVSVQEIVDILLELAPDAAISVGAGPYFHGPNVRAVTKGSLDIGRAQAEFGYAPAFDMRAGLKQIGRAHV